jgi:acyl dehydratase
MGDLSGTRSWLPDSEVPRRYAEVSKDFSAIHLEGLPGVILHGMHIFGQVVGMLDREAGRTHLTRVRMRFADVAVPGEPIEIALVPDENGVAFQGAQDGHIIVTSGRASFEEPSSVPH